MEHSIKILNYEKRFIDETFVDRELAKQKIADIDQALQLLQGDVSSSYNLVGKKFRMINKDRCHVVNVFTENEEELITYKKWSKSKQRWYHFTDYLELFMIQFDYGAVWI